MEKSIAGPAMSDSRHTNREGRHHDGAHFRSGRCGLWHWRDQAECATLGVSTAAAGKVDMGPVARSCNAAGVINQRVEIRQGKTAAHEDSGKEESDQAVREVPTHVTSLGSRL